MPGSSDELSDGCCEFEETVRDAQPTTPPEEPTAKKARMEPKEDLEDGELETDSDDELPQTAAPPPPPPLIERSDRKQNVRNQKSHINNNNNLDNHPRVDFPRGRRRRPEDFGVCKFYLRGNCTWNESCKYDHPTGAARQEWLTELGISDRFRRNDNQNLRRSRSRSPHRRHSPQNHRNKNHRQHNNNFSRRSPPQQLKKSPTMEKEREKDKEKERDKEREKERPGSPLASPVSSNGSRTHTPASLFKKRTPCRSRSPAAVSISSDDETAPVARRPVSPPRSRRSPSRSRSPRDRRARSTSSESNSSRSRSGTPPRRTDTTLGALLRKRRIESLSQTVSESSGAHPTKDSSDSEDDSTSIKRSDAIHRFFNKNPNLEPAVYKQPDHNLSLAKSPRPQSVTSSEDGHEDPFGSPIPHTPSPMPAEAEV